MNEKHVRLEIEIPGFYADDCDTDEDVEASMDLTSDDVVVVFQGAEGDSPGVMLRHMHGRIKRFRLIEAVPLSGGGAK